MKAHILTVNQDKKGKWFVMDNTISYDGKPVGKVSSSFIYRKNAILVMARMSRTPEFTNIYDLSQKDFNILSSER